MLKRNRSPRSYFENRPSETPDTGLKVDMMYCKRSGLSSCWYKADASLLCEDDHGLTSRPADCMATFTLSFIQECTCSIT